jgi:hypothetical protein
MWNFNCEPQCEYHGKLVVIILILIMVFGCFVILGSGGISLEVFESALGKILDKCTKEERSLLHMQLFLHLGIPELDAVQDDPDDFVYLVPSMTFPGIPVESYCRAVVGGNLVPHFFQMATVLREQGFVEDLVKGVVQILVDGVQKHHNVFPNALLMLTKLCRRSKGTEAAAGTRDKTYVEMLKKVLDTFLTFVAGDRSEKLAMLFRLAGVSCMTKEDYQSSGNDLGELLEEYGYDSSHRMAADSLRNFTKLFKLEVGDLEINLRVLECIEETIKALEFTDSEALAFNTSKKTTKMTWLDFVGIQAFLTKNIVDKYSSECKNACIGELEVQIGLWCKYKPKLTIEDYEIDSLDFDRFFSIIRKFGQKDKDRAELLPQFLKFSYHEVFIRKEGLKIIEKYLIPGADYDIAVQFINKALDTESMPSELQKLVPEAAKIAVLKLLCTNEQVKSRRDELVSEVFKNGSHSHFALCNFAMDINQVCSRIGSIEKEELSQVEHVSS